MVKIKCDMPGKNLGDQGVIDLIHQGQLKDCQILNLWDNKISDAGAIALARCPDLHNLQTLQLGWNRIGPAGAKELAHSPYLQNLQELLLYHNDVEDQGAQAIAQGSWQLSSVNMCNNQLTKATTAVMAESLNFHNVSTLHIGCNNLTSEGFQNLTKLPLLKNLNIRLNNVSGEDLVHFSNKAFPELDYLGIEDNPITDKGMEAIIQYGILQKTACLNLIECQLTPASMKLLANSKAKVTEIRLSGNDLGDEGLKFLLDGPFLSSVERLHLQWNNISRTGVEMLCRSNKLDRLCYLNLQGNNLNATDIPMIKAELPQIREIYC